MRIAVADLGTNSTRLLIADVDGGANSRSYRLTPVTRQTTVTRLGEGVDTAGVLAPNAIDRVVAALVAYRRAAEDAGAERFLGVATSAVRDAANGDELLSRGRREAGFDLQAISGEEEARLTFLGATAGSGTAEVTFGAEPSRGPQPPRESEPPSGSRSRPAGRTLVIDIGGGSTEFVIGQPGRAPEFSVSTALGSVRQTERHLHTDPPRPEELATLEAEVRRTIESAVPAGARAGIERAIAVAGTPTSLAAIEQALDPYDPDRVDGYRLSLETCEQLLGRLAAAPLEQRMDTVGLLPERAPTIVAGVAILVVAMRELGIGEVVVSEADILDGAALSAAATSA